MESEKYRDTAARQARPARGGQRDQPRHRALVFRERELAEDAYNGAQALDKLCAHVPDHFDLVLMDLQMPVMDGYEAARHIRALHDPQLSAIPIVTMTANALAQDLERERACGVSRHLSKPIDFTALHAALCEVLREN